MIINDRNISKVMLIFCLAMIACTTPNRRDAGKKLSEEDRLNSLKYDEGQQLFNEYCLSCHSIRKDGSVWPSVLELVAMDSAKRNELEKNILIDSVHRNIVVNMNEYVFKRIKFFIDDKGKVYSIY